MSSYGSVQCQVRGENLFPNIFVGQINMFCPAKITLLIYYLSAWFFVSSLLTQRVLITNIQMLGNYEV